MTDSVLAASPLRLGLLGSPNSGKTTLFNALTGLRAKVGNYPGVTVERREGRADVGRPAVVVDLPGTYSLDPLSPDEEVVNRVLDGEISEPPDALVVVVDACTLERSLLFVAQVLRRGLPTCVVLTMMDELAARGGRIDLARLEAALGVPVVGVVGHRGRGLDGLRELLGSPEGWSRPAIEPPEEPLERAAWADSIASSVLGARPGPSALTERVDRVVLHPLGGSLLFVAVMVIFFQLIFAWASSRDGRHRRGSSGSAVRRPPARPCPGRGCSTDFMADGLIAGVGSVVIFLPQILLLFALLYFLEDVGYMARPHS